MDTSKVIELAGGIRELAELLGVSTQAVYAWGDTVPKLRMYELRDLRPDWFTSGPFQTADKVNGDTVIAEPKAASVGL